VRWIGKEGVNGSDPLEGFAQPSAHSGRVVSDEAQAELIDAIEAGRRIAAQTRRQ